MSEWDATKFVFFMQEMMIKSVIVFALALLFYGVAKRASAATRHLILGCALLIMGYLVCLLQEAGLHSGLPHFSVVVATMPAHHQPVDNPYSYPSPLDDVKTAYLPPPPFSAYDPPAGYPLAVPVVGRLAQVWLAVWALVAGVLLLRDVIGFARLVDLTRKSRKIVDPRIVDMAGADALHVRFRQTDLVATPAMWGWVIGIVLLPTECLSWPDNRLRSVIAHEIAHLKRGDWLIGRLARIVCALLWCNPLGWIVMGILNREAEFACDDQVLGSGVSSATYAGELLEVASEIKSRNRLPEAIAIATSSDVGKRISAILDTNRRRGVRKALVVGAVFLTVQATLPTGAFRILTRPARYPVITGVVLDQNGKPVADADVNARFPGIESHLIGSKPPKFDNGYFDTYTDSAGRFSLRVLQDEADPIKFAGPSGTFLFATKGDATSQYAVFVWPGSHPVLHMVQNGMGYLEGIVVDGAGKPIKDATLSGNAWPCPQRFVGMDIDEVHTDARGHFRTGPIPVTSICDLNASKKGCMPDGPSHIRVTAGKTVSVGTIVLTPPTEWSFVDGIMVDGRGNPLPNLPIIIWGAGDDIDVKTDSRGHFHVAIPGHDGAMIDVPSREVDYGTNNLTAGTYGNRVVATEKEVQ